MPGRPPKPTALLELQGTFQKCRHGTRASEPKPSKGFPDAPEWLAPEGKAEWDRVNLAYAESGIVTQLDRGMLATYCQMWARFVASETAEPYTPLPASFISTMATIANKLGLDPSGRTKLRVPDEPKSEASPWDALRAPARTSTASGGRAN
jgi:phage terminase small subunit